MEIPLRDAETLVTQLQHSHRIAAAFYRRFLPLLDDTASQLGCQFKYWGPELTDMPCKSVTRPGSKWAWDFLPLFASNHVYWRSAGGSATPEDVGIYFLLYIDDAFVPENRQKNKIKGQPDAVTLPIGRALLQAFLFRPVKKSSKSFQDLWYQTDVDPEFGCTEMQELDEHMKGIVFEWQLSEVLANQQIIVQTLKPFCEETHAADGDKV